MIFEVLLVLPLYLGIFAIFFRFWHIIKVMTKVNDILTELLPETFETINKRQFFMEKLQNGESISNSKTPWTLERLEKASEKVVDKLYEKYQNPLPVKINKQKALELGKPFCPTVIEMYAEGLKTLVDQMPYISEKYAINVEKLKTNISTNKIFCDNLAIKIGSKLIEQMGENSATHIGVSLAAMTWDAVEKVQKPEVEDILSPAAAHAEPRGDLLGTNIKSNE